MNLKTLQSKFVTGVVISALNDNRIMLTAANGSQATGIVGEKSIRVTFSDGVVATFDK